MIRGAAAGGENGFSRSPSGNPPATTPVRAPIRALLSFVANLSANVGSSCGRGETTSTPDLLNPIQEAAGCRDCRVFRVYLGSSPASAGLITLEPGRGTCHESDSSNADLPVGRNNEAADPRLDVLRPEDLGDASCESAPRRFGKPDDEDSNRRTLRKLTKIQKSRSCVTRNRPAVRAASQRSWSGRPVSPSSDTVSTS